MRSWLVIQENSDDNKRKGDEIFWWWRKSDWLDGWMRSRWILTCDRGCKNENDCKGVRGLQNIDSALCIAARYEGKEFRWKESGSKRTRITMVITESWQTGYWKGRRHVWGIDSLRVPKELDQSEGFINGSNGDDDRRKRDQEAAPMRRFWRIQG